MGNPRITYGSKVIDLPGREFEFYVDAFIPRTVNTTLTGVVETLRIARVDVRVKASWRHLEPTLRVQLDNWWQWAQQGNVWRLVLDSAKNVKTFLVQSASVAQSTVLVADPGGITAGQDYVLVGGANYQMVTVSTVSGNAITLGSLDYSFASGAVFRDRYLWDAVITDAGARAPIQDLLESPSPASPGLHRFNLMLEFREWTAFIYAPFVNVVSQNWPSQTPWTYRRPAFAAQGWSRSRNQLLGI